MLCVKRLLTRGGDHQPARPGEHGLSPAAEDSCSARCVGTGADSGALGASALGGSERARRVHESGHLWQTVSGAARFALLSLSAWEERRVWPGSRARVFGAADLKLPRRAQPRATTHTQRAKPPLRNGALHLSCLLLCDLFEKV